MAEWYYAKGGQQLGPVTDDDLRQKVASGEVSAQDLVWRDGMANWQAASSVSELAGGGGGYAAAPQAGGYGAPAPYQQAPQAGYPPQGGYPAQGYPQQGYPQGYPQQGYQQAPAYQAPAGYPQQGGYAAPGQYPPGQYGAPQPMGYGGYGPPVGGYGAPSFAKNAQTAMIWSIIGLLCFGIILGPVGLIMGINAKKNMARVGNFEGQGMATAAIVIGIIDIVAFFGLLAINLGNA